MSGIYMFAWVEDVTMCSQEVLSCAQVQGVRITSSICTTAYWICVRPRLAGTNVGFFPLFRESSNSRDKVKVQLKFVGTGDRVKVQLKCSWSESVLRRLWSGLDVFPSFLQSFLRFKEFCYVLYLYSVDLWIIMFISCSWSRMHDVSLLANNIYS